MNTKQEFIDGLRRALTGRISQEEVEEHIRYYEDYITAESRIKGSEKEVMNVLGDPRLIAMSICAADEAETQRGGSYGAYNKEYGDRYTYDSQSNAYGDKYGYGRDEGAKSECNNGKDNRPFIFRHPKLTFAMIIIGILIVIVLIIALAFSLLKLLWPVIVVAVLAILIVRMMAYFINK